MPKKKKITQLKKTTEDEELEMDISGQRLKVCNFIKDVNDLGSETGDGSRSIGAFCVDRVKPNKTPGRFFAMLVSGRGAKDAWRNAHIFAALPMLLEFFNMVADDFDLDGDLLDLAEEIDEALEAWEKKPIPELVEEAFEEEEEEAKPKKKVRRKLKRRK